MKKTFDDFISHNSAFGWIALTTVAILLVPLVAMQFTAEVQWDELAVGVFTNPGS